MRLIKFICYIFRCKPGQLRAILTIAENRQFLDEKLKMKHLEFYTNHLKENRKVDYFSLSTRTADTQYAYNGFMGITVSQHMYSRHRKILKHANLPCVMELKGVEGKHIDYWPLEVLDVYF